MLNRLLTSPYEVDISVYDDSANELQDALLFPLFREKEKRTQRDSNPRHSVPKTDALSTELWVHRPHYIINVNQAWKMLPLH